MRLSADGSAGLFGVAATGDEKMSVSARGRVGILICFRHVGRRGSGVVVDISRPFSPPYPFPGRAPRQIAHGQRTFGEERFCRGPGFGQPRRRRAAGNRAFRGVLENNLVEWKKRKAAYRLLGSGRRPLWALGECA